jgi:hypothetical protein
MAKSAGASRAYDETYLEKYSEEHLWYEVDMLIGVGRFLSIPTTVGGPTAEDARRVSNLVVEGFGIHVRNVIDFLYLGQPKSADVVAVDYCDPGVWKNVRPPMSATLSKARARANKELAHLTTARIPGLAPEKKWDAVALLGELKPVLKLWLKTARASAVSTRIRELIDSL